MSVTPSNQLVAVDEALAPVRQILARNAKGIGAALGNYMQPERFMSAVVTLCRHNPDLADPRKTAPATLLLSVLRVAHLQLSPDPALGQAWIIPRNGRAEFQLGWKGALALAYRSPLVAAVRYGVVGPTDRFVWRDGASWVLEHDPSEDGWPVKMADIKAAWCIIELRSGRQLPRVMYQREIIRHKERGAGKQPAWQTDPAAMAVKTVIGDACRRGPFEGEIGRAFALDHLGELGQGQPLSEDERTIELAPEETAVPRKPSDRFKEAHRQTDIEVEVTTEPEPDPTDPGPEPLPEDGPEPPILTAFDMHRLELVTADTLDTLGSAWSAVRNDLGNIAKDDLKALRAIKDERKEWLRNHPPAEFIPAPEGFDHIARVSAAAAAKGLTEGELYSLLGGRLAEMPPEAEDEAMRLIEAAQPKETA